MGFSQKRPHHYHDLFKLPTVQQTSKDANGQQHTSALLAVQQPPTW